MDKKTQGTLEMSVAMAISGTIGWFVVQSGLPTLEVVFWRCAFGVLALGLVCWAMGLLRGMTWRIARWAALGGVAIVTNWLLLFGAYSHASISVATAVYNTQPFMLVVFGALLFGERITLAKLGWLVTAFGGMLLIAQARPSADLPGSNYALGIAMALGAAFFWAVASVVAKRLTGTPPHLIAMVQVAVGVFMLAPFANLGTPPQDAVTWLLLVTLGVVHTGLMYILLYGAVQKLPTYLQGALSFIYPVVAISVDYVAFDHRLQPAQWLGAAAILVAAAAMSQQTTRGRSAVQNPAGIGNTKPR
ncbi:MAG: DMT family transporter [Acidovorax sp.]|jgi:drug/metabolite transporter (DMT)-like permease|uniref:DMT family transporter n=1 Tax=Acidovorax sp. TaxID=1872122 RepID=UPI00260C7127|nr:DMT family transporter [Acidovorax sp.]MDH4419620.1 DMT family transporter [Acidovorax sp.]